MSDETHENETQESAETAPGTEAAGSAPLDSPEEQSAQLPVAGEAPGEPLASEEAPPAGEAGGSEAPSEAETGEEPGAGEAVQGEETLEESEAPEDEEAPAGPVEDDRYTWRWYAIHAYSGQEGNVKKHIEAEAEQLGISDRISSILVPMEEVAEIKGGEKRISKRKFFPGYVLIRLPEHPERDADLWHLIKNTAGVSGFIGSRTAPVPLDESEVNAILEELRGERERPKPKVQFEEGERVKIIDGPFANFLGNVSEINAERGTLKVSVEIFERQTSVEVEFWQVEKM